jgi:two-component system, NtrC family, sensor histidine kinase HydH
MENILKLFGLGKGASFNITRAFSVLSLILIALIFSLLSYIQSQFLTEQVLSREAGLIKDFVQSIVAAEDTTSHFFVDPEHGPTPQLESFYNHMGNMPDVLAAVIYDSSGRIIWSTQKDTIGTKYSDNDELEEALRGELVYENGIVGEVDKQEHSKLLSDAVGAWFVETYVPIASSSNPGKVVGVVEMYRVPQALQKSIGAGLWRLWLAGLASAAALYLVLWWIVQRASKIIAQQHQRLTEIESLAMIGETATAVVHNIRNPLASMRAAAELIAGDDIEGARESAKDIVAEVDRLNTYTRELLHFSRTAGEKSVIDVNNLVANVAKEFDQRSNAAAARCKLELAQTLPEVEIHAEALQHALMSLLSNARDATRNGKPITISTRLEPGATIVIAVADQGPGMDKDMMDKAMRPFFTTKPDGTGLGLPLARQIMERMGGYLALKSGNRGLIAELGLKAH